MGIWLAVAWAADLFVACFCGCRIGIAAILVLDMNRDKFI